MNSEHCADKNSKNVNDLLFFQIFDGMIWGVAYCDLIVDENGKPFDYRYLLVNSVFEKQSNRCKESTIGLTVKEIIPDVKNSWIAKIGSVVLDETPIQFTYFDQDKKKYFHVNVFSQGNNKFVMIIDDITIDINSIEQLTLQNDEYEKCIVNLVISNDKLAYQNDEKDKRVAEFVIANKKLAFQNNEIDKSAIELVIANNKLAFQNNEKEKLELDLFIAKEKAEESGWIKSAFLANISHEIRTPMNGILGFSELLKSPNLSTEKQREYIRVIEKSGYRMLNTINGIISISKIGSGLMRVDISEFSVNEIIEYIHTFFKLEVEAKGLQFLMKNQLPDHLAIIETDREKIHAILMNLVENAIKFTQVGIIEVGYIEKGEYLEFYVKDTGIGIDKGREISIFDRFIQADISDIHSCEVSGFGLSISKAYIEMLGGKIRVESEKSKGSIFYFTVPYLSNVKIAKGNIVNTSIDIFGPISYKNKNLKILIVEDDEISDLLLSIRLKDLSRDIIHAKNGLEAIAVCRNNLDIDLILMDMKMSVMDGYEATKKIRKFNKDVIIIAQTAHAFDSFREKALEYGCNECLSKPLVIKDLLSLMQYYFSMNKSYDL